MASRVSLVCVLRNPVTILKLCDNRNKPHSLMSLAIAFLSTGEAREGELMVLKNEYHKLKKKLIL